MKKSKEFSGAGDTFGAQSSIKINDNKGGLKPQKRKLGDNKLGSSGVSFVTSQRKDRNVDNFSSSRIDNKSNNVSEFGKSSIKIDGGGGGLTQINKQLGSQKDTFRSTGKTHDKIGQSIISQNQSRNMYNFSSLKIEPISNNVSEFGKSSIKIDGGGGGLTQINKQLSSQKDTFRVSGATFRASENQSSNLRSSRGDAAANAQLISNVLRLVLDYELHRFLWDYDNTYNDGYADGIMFDASRIIWRGTTAALGVYALSSLGRDVGRFIAAASVSRFANRYALFMLAMTTCSILAKEDADLKIHLSKMVLLNATCGYLYATYGGNIFVKYGASTAYKLFTASVVFAGFSALTFVINHSALHLGNELGALYNSEEGRLCIRVAKSVGFLSAGAFALSGLAAPGRFMQSSYSPICLLGGLSIPALKAIIYIISRANNGRDRAFLVGQYASCIGIAVLCDMGLQPFMHFSMRLCTAGIIAEALIESSAGIQGSRCNQSNYESRDNEMMNMSVNSGLEGGDVNTLGGESYGVNQGSKLRSANFHRSTLFNKENYMYPVEEIEETEENDATRAKQQSQNSQCQSPKSLRRTSSSNLTEYPYPEVKKSNER